MQLPDQTDFRITSTISPTFFRLRTSFMDILMPKASSTSEMRVMWVRESQSSISAAVVSSVTVISSSKTSEKT